jgi:hypothetical protein
MLLDYLNVPDAWWRLYANIAVLGLGFVIVILLRKDIKDLTTTEFTGSIYIFGFFLAFTLFSNFKEFITEMRSEIVGMCIDIGLVYLIIEHTLSNDRKREEREKEKSAYKHYLRENLSYLLPELDRRYMSLFKDSTTKDISDYFVENFDEQNIKWELFAGNSGTRSYNYLFREFASKEVEKLILIYNRVMPNDLLHHLLSLENELRYDLDINKLHERYKNNPEKINSHIVSTLRDIGNLIIGMYSCTIKLEEEIVKDTKKSIEEKRRKLMIRKKVTEVTMKLVQFFKSRKPRGKSKNKDKDNNISTNA